ncbi:MAG: hypothetical protein IKL53_10075 [Lachnospiraceae bacterium]|nr:hypothetical protein [Lachnospiraceae bacterium]
MNTNETVAFNTNRLAEMTGTVSSLRDQSQQATRVAWNTRNNVANQITDQYRTLNNLGTIASTEARASDQAYQRMLSDIRDRVASQYYSLDRGGDDVIRAMDAAARLRLDDEATPGLLAYVDSDSDSVVYGKPTTACYWELDNNYVKLDDTVPITENSDFRLASKEFRDVLVNNGLADISDKDNQLIIKIADSMLYKLGKEAAKQKKLASVAENISTRAQKMRDQAIKEKHDAKMRASDAEYEVLILKRKVADLEDKLSKSYIKPSRYMARWVTDTIDGNLDNMLLNNSPTVSNRLNDTNMDRDLPNNETVYGLGFNQAVESLARSILTDLEDYANNHGIRIPPEYLSVGTLHTALSNSIRSGTRRSTYSPEVSRIVGDAISHNRPIFLPAFFSRFVTPPHRLTIAYVVRTVYRDVEIAGSLDINVSPIGTGMDNN